MIFSNGAVSYLTVLKDDVPNTTNNDKATQETRIF